MRTEYLVESQATELTLTAEQVDQISALGRKLASRGRWWGDSAESADSEARSVIVCRPTTSGQWQLRVDNCVGVLAVADLQLIVKPKIPTPHLLFLFEASGQFPRLDREPSQISDDDSFWILMATWYVSQAERLMRLGLVRDYVRIEDVAPALRGELDLRRTANAFYSGHIELHCHFDEFEEDTPINRVIKSALHSVASSAVLPLVLRKRAMRALRRLDHIGPFQPADLTGSVERRSGHYAPALSLAKHILLGIGRGLESGSARGWSFLIRTPEMVEAGVRTLLQHRFPPPLLRKQGIRLEGSSLTITPDLVIAGGAAVADVKYKRTASDWQRADLYQIVAFATAFGAPQAAVISFLPTAGAVPANVRVGPVTVTQLTWLADPRIAPAHALDSLETAVGIWLRQIADVTELSA